MTPQQIRDFMEHIPTAEDISELGLSDENLAHMKDLL